MELELGLQIIREAVPITFASSETEAVFITAAFLPGFTRDQIEVTTKEEERKISIRGHIASKEAVITRRIAITRELVVEHLEEAFLVPNNVDWDGIDAWFDEEKEILFISIPKLMTNESSRIGTGGRTSEFSSKNEGQISEQLVVRERGEEKDQRIRDLEVQGLMRSHQGTKKVEDDTEIPQRPSMTEELNQSEIEFHGPKEPKLLGFKPKDEATKSEKEGEKHVNEQLKSPEEEILLEQGLQKEDQKWMNPVKKVLEDVREASKTEESMESKEEPQGGLQKVEKIRQKTEMPTERLCKELLKGVEPPNPKENESKKEREEQQTDECKNTIVGPSYKETNPMKPMEEDKTEQQHEILQFMQAVDVFEARPNNQSKYPQEGVLEHDKLIVLPIYENFKPAVSVEMFKSVLKAIEDEDNQWKKQDIDVPKDLFLDHQKKQVIQNKVKPSAGPPIKMPKEAEELTKSDKENRNQLKEQLEQQKERNDDKLLVGPNQVLIEHRKPHGKSTCEKPVATEFKQNENLGKIQEDKDDIWVSKWKEAPKTRESIQLKECQYNDKLQLLIEDECQWKMTEIQASKSRDYIKPKEMSQNLQQRISTFKEVQHDKAIKEQEKPQVDNLPEKTTPRTSNDGRKEDECHWKKPCTETDTRDSSISKKLSVDLKQIQEKQNQKPKKPTLKAPEQMLEAAQSVGLQVKDIKEEQHGEKEYEKHRAEEKEPRVWKNNILGSKELVITSSVQQMIEGNAGRELQISTENHDHEIVTGKEEQITEFQKPDEVLQKSLLEIGWPKLQKARKNTQQEKEAPLDELIMMKESQSNAFSEQKKLHQSKESYRQSKDDVESRQASNLLDFTTTGVQEPQSKLQKKEHGQESTEKTKNKNQVCEKPTIIQIYQKKDEKLHVLAEKESIEDGRSTKLREHQAELQYSEQEEQDTGAEPNHQKPYQKEDNREVKQPTVEQSHQALKETELSTSERHGTNFKVHKAEARKYEIHESKQTEDEGRLQKDLRKMATCSEETEGDIHILRTTKEAKEHNSLEGLNKKFVEQQNPNEEVEKNSLEKRLIQSEETKKELESVKDYSQTPLKKPISLMKQETDAAIELESIGSVESKKYHVPAMEPPYQTHKIINLTVPENLELQHKLQEKDAQYIMSSATPTYQEETDKKIMLLAEEKDHELGSIQESHNQKIVQQQEPVEEVGNITLEKVLLESEKPKKESPKPQKQEKSLCKDAIIEVAPEPFIEHIEFKESHNPTLKDPYQNPGMINFTAPEEQVNGGFEKHVVGSLTKDPTIEELRSLGEQDSELLALNKTAIEQEGIGSPKLNKAQHFPRQIKFRQATELDQTKERLLPESLQTELLQTSSGHEITKESIAAQSQTPAIEGSRANKEEEKKEEPQEARGIYISKEVEEGEPDENSSPPLDHDIKNPEIDKREEAFSSEEKESSGEKMNKCTKKSKQRRRRSFHCCCRSPGRDPAFPLPPSTLFAGSAFLFSVTILLFHFIKPEKHI